MRLFFFFAATVFLSENTLGEEVVFSRDVLPILSENCFFCHGPDKDNRAADLRFDQQASALTVITPGDHGDSELFRRIESTDVDEVMPPPDSNRQLTADQKDVLKRWIQQGAQWGKHWAFEPIIKPEVPPRSFQNFPIRNVIDSFVQQTLKANDLQPSPAAAKHRLLRRLSLDLTGLPPTREELKSFLNDNQPAAYERAVDRILDKPAYGERMAWNWLDAARYADTNGYQGDRERTMWPWRDWVVTAFNQNLPFDDFTKWQLAGDLLPDATEEQILATGFCRNHMINGEGGRIAEENRVDYVMDMSETMGTVWLGLTLNCCRCHDHKYDPLTQEEYYQFYAYFNQTPVTGQGGDPQTAPNLAVFSADQRRQKARLEQQLQAQKTRLADLQSQTSDPDQQVWEAAYLANQSNDWQTLTPSEWKADHQKLRPLDDGSFLAEGPNPDKDAYTIAYTLPPGTYSSLQLEAIRHPTMTEGRLARSDSGNFVLTDFQVSIQAQEKTEPIGIESAQATFEQGPHKISNSIDDDRGTGWAVLNGRSIDRDHAGIFRFRRPIKVSTTTKLSVTMRFESQYRLHNLGRFRISMSEKPNAPFSKADQSLARFLQIPPTQRTIPQQKRIRTAYLESRPEFTSVIQQVSQTRQKLNDLSKAASKVMVMKDRSEWRPTFVLNRGLYNDVTEQEVTAQTPNCLPPSGQKSRSSRLQLAEWLTSDQHPLTARVIVNRFWQQIFGIGLVKTSEDFGVQAEYPVHKDLLDWLAADFREHDWDVKRLIKQIVTSHTYRQSSVNATAVSTIDGNAMSLIEVDPENRLLARAARYRMPSWMLRDHALAASGLLNHQLGGPPINTYQPEGVWEEATFGKKTYKQATGDQLYRRSLYIFWRRIIAPTMFFDNASRQTCTVKTLRTNTPLHALLTLNETTYVEAARHLAQSLLSDNSMTTDADRLNVAFERIVSRPANQRERQILLAALDRSRQQYADQPDLAQQLLSVGDSERNENLDAAQHAAWTQLCLTVFNLDETLSRE